MSSGEARRDSAVFREEARRNSVVFREAGQDGPAASAHLAEALCAYGESGIYPFHMPGHKRNSALLAAIDITEIDGFDDLHAPEGILEEELDAAAAFYGTRSTLFSVNGSTGALLAAVSAAVPFGGEILMARNCHRSVYHAACLRHLRASFVLCEEGGLVGENGGEARIPFSGGAVSAEAVEEALRAHPGVRAVVVTSPTYDGIVSDIPGIAAAAHRHGAVLIVDEAHGAHFSMHPYFPASAVKEGADLVVQSLHKTLPAFTQTALLHNVTGRVPAEALQRFFNIYETSSPSYVLMASGFSCIRAMREKKEAFFAPYAEALRQLRGELAALGNFRLLAGTGRFDPSKLLLAGPEGGPALYDALRLRFGLQPEMKTPAYALLMTSVGDTEEGFRRLTAAMRTLDAEAGKRARSAGRTAAPHEAGGTACGGRREQVLHPLYQRGLPEAALPMGEALDAERETVPVREAAGRICAGFADCYPPDLPFLVPGEVVPEEIGEILEGLEEAGIRVRGVGNGIPVVR